MEWLFLDTDYKEKVYDVGFPQPVLCLEAACTDHDLTGQVVWPVSVALARFATTLRGRIVEVGAGCGLPGLAAARSGETTVALTDGSDVVLDLLRQSVARFGSRAKVFKLVWGDRGSVEDFLSEFGEPVDVVIGADVVAWPTAVEPLLQTVRALGAPVFYCGFVCRATSTRDLFYAQARRYGFDVAGIGDDPRGLEDPQEQQTRALLRITRKTEEGRIPLTFLSDDPEAYENSRPAC
ncbi:hypothetical protein CTAYLR_009150 [Chrysophaeum taylorii]|uniref:Uncharacterized protein n=1 Tax=Chrysophaeum taylorii TaxID=2483200 RepID=A0AAD7XMQ2_9STRA|nr:hypothetical protein CTAYLR_009150 [Chrysophaeum taylorii]